MSDAAVAETQRIRDEYDAAAADVVGNPSPDPFAKARFDRAQLAVRENRRMWREVGQFVGDRPVSEDPSMPDHAVGGIKTVDDEAAPAALLEG